MPFMIVDQHLYKHPKTRELARILKQHPRYATGVLVEVWGWAIDAKPDGMIADVPSDTLAGVFGHQLGSVLVGALRNAYFICDERCLRRGLPADKHRAGRFHDWEQYAGKLVEGRARDALRQEHNRGKHVRPVDNCPKCERAGAAEGPETTTQHGASTESRGSQQGVSRQGTTTRPLDSTHPAPARPADKIAATPSNGAQQALLSSGQPEPVQRTSSGQENLSKGRTEPSQAEPSQAKPSTPLPPMPSAARTGTASDTARQVEALLEGTSDERWRGALEVLMGTLTAGQVLSWFAGTHLMEIDASGGEYAIAFPNGFARDFAVARYRSAVREALSEVTGRTVQPVEFVLALSTPEPAHSSAGIVGPKQSTGERS